MSPSESCFTHGRAVSLPAAGFNVRRSGPLAQIRVGTLQTESYLQDNLLLRDGLTSY